MNKETAKMLVQKFQDGNLSVAENELLENYLEKGWIDLEELSDLHAIHNNLKLEETEIPSKEMQQVFYENLENEKSILVTQKSSSTNWWNQFNFSKINWALGVVALLLGVLLGNLFSSNSSDEIKNLASQLQQTQETMMLALLEKESSRDRLKAVKITQEMSNVSSTVIEGLLTTLNNDENVNVRLAAIESLSEYAQNPVVREGLVKSIQNQNSPLVQLKLAELMVYLQDKSSVQEFKDLIKEKEIPTDVKNQLEEQIKVLL